MGRRRKRRLTLTVSAVLVLVLLVVLFGPWGPFKGVLFSHAKSTGSHKVAGNSNPGRKSDGNKPRPPGRVEKTSITKPPAVAIVVDDVGNTTERLPFWTAIDAALSFSVMPYPPLSQALAEELYKAGYVIMLHVPTQNAPPHSFAGKGQLACGMDRDTVFATLDADVATVPHAAGMNNHQGGLGCDDLELMTYECEWAKGRGLFVVDSNSSNNSKVSQAAVSLGMGRRKNQVFIDHQNDPDYIRNAMRELAGIARRDGTAIGICHWHRPNTASVVGEMVKVLKAEGIHFAFAGDINN